MKSFLFNPVLTLLLSTDFGSVDIEFKQLLPEKVETTVHNDSGLDVPLTSPKVEVARVEADSSTSTTEKVTSQSKTSQKRRRTGKSEGSDSDDWHTPPRRGRSGSLKKKRNRESPDRERASSSVKKPAKETGRPSTKHKRLKGFVIRPREVNLPPRVVSNSETGLQITILRGRSLVVQHSGDRKKYSNFLKSSIRSSKLLPFGK